MEKEGGELKIKCFQREQQIVIQIQDDGIGMSSEELKKRPLIHIIAQKGLPTQVWDLVLLKGF